MADNIIKLRIESGEYEQKLKRAADGLQRFGEEAHQVGKAIDLADKEQANYIRMIGQMETVNRSARGKINDCQTLSSSSHRSTVTSPTRKRTPPSARPSPAASSSSSSASRTASENWKTSTANSMPPAMKAKRPAES